MKKYSFTKMNGAGNDFIVIDNERNSSLSLTAELIRRLSDRRFGIGADGVIRVSKTDGHDYNMEYYNADGSTGMLCGNGARCAARFAFDNGMLNTRYASFTNNGMNYGAKILDDGQVKFFLNDIHVFRTHLNLTVGTTRIISHFVDNGTNHLIVFCEDINDGADVEQSFRIKLKDIPVEMLGRAIRHADEFKPAGTNVNFVELEDNRLFIRTYERGVEGETLACGTGSVAAAVICSAVKKAAPPFDVVTASGKLLRVDFSTDGEVFTKVALTGPAEVNYYGEFVVNK